MKKYLLLSFFCMLMVSMVTGCGSLFPPDDSPTPTVTPTISPTPTGGIHGSLKWTNQIKMPGTTNWVRDAYIFSANGNWYMTGTRQIIEEKDSGDLNKLWPGFFLWKSTDNMNNWQEVGWILRNEDIQWSDEKLWAPEIKKSPLDGKFYMTYSANTPVEVTKPDGTKVIELKAKLGMAVANDLEGTWTNLTPDKPLTDNNDGSLFFDDDGKVYIWQTGWNLMQVDLSSERPQIIPINGQQKISFQSQLLGPTDSWCGPKKRNEPRNLNTANEGTHMIKINGTYYLFWSCNAWGYFVGYATAKNILGPYTPNVNNPIWGAADANNPDKDPAPDCPFDEVGHGTPFIGPDGKWWIVGHGRAISRPSSDPNSIYNQPLPCMDRLNFNEATGEFTGKLTWTEQTVTW